MASGLIGAGALASNLSLLPLLFGSSSTSTGAAGDLSGAASTDPFASVVAQAESAPFVSQNFLSNLAAGHSVISAAAPLLAPDSL
ncbi:MAG TPA: hypothetical protein VEN81_13625, partial [Planctomycetota bacterium]|nr:hypothetical protein [Planctomycetota bacterium]